jgi:transcriptional regulator with XRE-family HTH domain
VAKHKEESPLRNIRRTRTISQAELARLIGVTQDVISRAERGQIRLRPDVQARIAAILGSSPQALFPEREAVAS